MADEPRARTRHADLSLSEVAEALPGTGQVMAEVSHTFTMAWHAVHGGNWELAAYYLRRTRGLLGGLAVTRPKYLAQIREYDAGHLEPLYASVLERDIWSFDARYEGAVDQANVYHVATGHPYIRWSRPAQVPDPGVDLASEH